MTSTTTAGGGLFSTQGAVLAVTCLATGAVAATLVLRSRRASNLDFARLKKELFARPSGFRTQLVAHRGFHFKSDCLERPLENTLPAYERAWSAGVKYCECDVTLTKDGELILCHDDNLKRLSAQSLNHPISEMKFKDELEFVALKDGSRVAKLSEVLEAAKRVGQGSQLVIEIKGDDEVCAQKLYENMVIGAQSHLGNYIAIVMGFSLPTVKEFANLNKANEKQILTMLLTVTDRNRDAYQFFDLDETDKVSEVISKAGIDGLYLKYHRSFLTDDRFVQLCKKHPIGVWGGFLDPDSEVIAAKLISRGAKFVNSDFPNGFFGKSVDEELTT